MNGMEAMLDKAGKSAGSFSLAGKKALVVGGNKGLGQGMALALAAAGADVCVAARGPAGFRETVGAIEKLGRKGMAVACDAAVEDNVAMLIDKTAGGLGGLDVVVNSQGIVHLQPAEEFDMEQWQRVMDVNLKSVVLVCRHAGREMLGRGGGKIVNISSVRGFQGRSGDLAYSPSKGAINQLTKSLAIEWGPRGVNVNAIAPSFIRTEINASFLSDPAKRDWVYSRSPMGRLGEIEDMFGPVVFLASEASNFVNGHVLMVDGGWTIA